MALPVREIPIANVQHEVYGMFFYFTFFTECLSSRFQRPALNLCSVLFFCWYEEMFYSHEALPYEYKDSELETNKNTPGKELGYAVQRSSCHSASQSLAWARSHQCVPVAKIVRREGMQFQCRRVDNVEEEGNRITFFLHIVDRRVGTLPVVRGKGFWGGIERSLVSRKDIRERIV